MSRPRVLWFCALLMAALFASSAPVLAAPDPEEFKKIRDEAIALIESKRTDEHRAEFEVIVPEEISPLPQSYELVLFGEYIGWKETLRDIDVRRRGDSVAAEMITAGGIRRGSLPVPEIDRMVTIFRLIGESTAKLRKRDNFSLGGGWTSHMPDYTLTLRSLEEGNKLRIRTIPWQPNATEIVDQDHALKRFAHTWLTNNLIELLDEHLSLLEPNETLQKEVLTRLGAMERKGLILTGIEHRPRKSVQALLYAHLLLDWGNPAALPEFDRLGMKYFNDRLKIVVADDPTELIDAAMKSGDRDLRLWVQEWVANNSGQREHRKLLLDRLSRIREKYEIVELLRDLQGLPTDGLTNAAAQRLFDDESRSAMVRAAAGLLVEHAGDRTSFDFLRELALELPENFNDRLDDESVETWWDALLALLSAASRNENYRAEGAEVARTLLGRIPKDAHSTFSGNSMLVRSLGVLGEYSDVPLLAKYGELDDPALAGDAIFSIARFDPAIGVAKAHGQIQRYLDRAEHSSYRWSVWPFLQLICAQRDKESIPLLEAARPRMHADWPDSKRSHEELDVLIDLLRCGDAQLRLDLTVRFIELQDYWYPNCRDLLRKRLLQEGLSTERCAELLPDDAR